MNYTPPPASLASRSELSQLRFLRPSIVYLFVLSLAPVFVTVGIDTCYVTDELLGGIFGWTGLIVIILAPILVPTIAAFFGAPARVFASLLGAQLLSIFTLSGALLWNDAHHWEVHSSVGMSSILIAPYVGFIVVCTLLSTGVFFLARALRSRLARNASEES